MSAREDFAHYSDEPCEACDEAYASGAWVLPHVVASR